MPETAPLDVNDPTVGFELDSITLRNIASARYIRHHEWLDHVLGDPLPTSAIVPPDLLAAIDKQKVEERAKKLDEEIAELEKEKEKGWQFHVDNKKAEVLRDAIHKLRKDFGTGSYESTKKEVEDFLGVSIEQVDFLRPVEITYDRKAVDLEQALQAAEREAEGEGDESDLF